MKSPTLALVFVALTTTVLACGEKSPTAPAAPPFDPADLVGRWVRSFEEESSTEDPGVEWYRPADSRDFAPAWFRMAYEFRADGRCGYLWLSPVDAHEMRAGTWDFAADDPRVVRIFDDQGDELPQLSFRIVTLHDRLLRMDHGR